MTLGMPPHSDHGLFTVLIQNQVGGCRFNMEKGGGLMSMLLLINSILVNTGDHLEIFSNGKYRSVLHRAVVNNEKTRLSIPMANGPLLEAVVRPSGGQLLQTPAYAPMKYKDYLFGQQSNPINDKSYLIKKLVLQN